VPAAPELTDAWLRIRSELHRAVADSAYHLWLEPLRPRALDDGALTLAAPPATSSWVARRFARVLSAAVTTVLGPGASVCVVAADSPSSPPERGARPAPESPAFAAHGTAFHPKYTFDQFVIGDGNRLAHAAALAVAELPGHAYNPLFIYGPPGLGKTHLLHAIGNYLNDHGSGLSVGYATAETFTNSFLSSLHDGKGERFKALYRAHDVLLIDDVQFLERKAKTEEEFFHTFNVLHEAGSQLVLTSDRLPRDLSGLEDRLRERFEAGLVTDLGAPDIATRLAILRKRVERDHIELADDSALEVIAQRMRTNMRALEGALIRVVALHSLTNRPIDGELATEVLDSLYPATHSLRRITVREVQQATAAALGVTLDELLSTTRARRVSWPRQVAMYLARELTDATLPAIGEAFGGRNHATVIHACDRTRERTASDPSADAAVKAILQQLSDSA